MALILHVSEAWGGGIIGATEWLASRAPSHEHHVLYVPRGAVARPPDPSIFARTFEVTGGRRAFTKTARQLMASPIYDVVHSHSSWAGAVCRLFGSRKVPHFYSPHCFAFERRDINDATRRIFRMVESAAVDKTMLLIANGSFEADLAVRLGHRHIIDMPMVGAELPRVELTADPSRPRIAMLGRVVPQKDPEYFARVVDIVRRRMDVDVEAVWIGASDTPGGDDFLRSRDITVTGWLSPDEVALELSKVSCYVHSAAWEAGAPLAVFDAARAGLPVITRGNPCLSWTEFASAPTLIEHAALVVGVLEDGRERERILELTKHGLARVTNMANAIDLDASYGPQRRLRAA